jgi:UDPglucose 6-dehydrogenase
MIRRVDEVGDPLQLAVVGCGYVGLVTAACFAHLGRRVVAIDRDAARIEGLQRGVMPIEEPGLAELVRAGMSAGRLEFSTDLGATHDCDAVLVAVGTLDAHGDWTSRYVEQALGDIVADAQAPRTIVIRSTLLPGTTARLSDATAAADPDVELCFNPEFTRQGNAVDDFMAPDRIVIGATRATHESRAVPLLIDAYADVRAPLIVTDAASAELIKIGSNVFLAMKIGFANEIARLSAAADVDVAAVIEGIGLDRRIDRRFMTPGPGFGGSCLPSQARALAEHAQAMDVEAPIVGAIHRSNAHHAEWVVGNLEREIGDLTGRTVGLLGLTFKPGTGDVRESPALSIAHLLVERGVRVVAHDPHADPAGIAAAGEWTRAIERADSVDAAARGANAIVAATDWPEYRALDWPALAATMAGTIVIDARGALDPAAVTDAGLRLVVHGRETRPR